jgi:hypothetical protein
LQSREDDPGTGGDLTGEGVDRIQGLEALEAENHLAAKRHATTHQSGVAPLGNQGNAELPAGRDDTCYFLGGTGPHDGHGAALEPPCPVRCV